MSETCANKCVSLSLFYFQARPWLLFVEDCIILFLLLGDNLAHPNSCNLSVFGIWWWWSWRRPSNLPAWLSGLGRMRPSHDPSVACIWWALLQYRSTLWPLYFSNVCILSTCLKAGLVKWWPMRQCMIHPCSSRRSSTAVYLPLPSKTHCGRFFMTFSTMEFVGPVPATCSWILQDPKLDKHKRECCLMSVAEIAGARCSRQGFNLRMICYYNTFTLCYEFYKVGDQPLQ